MSEIDLSTLSRRELRRLLDVSRERGQAEASYQILQEMAARRKAEEARKGLFPGRRGAKPHVVAVDLGDPMEQAKDDLPPPSSWRPPPHPELESEPAAGAPAEAAPAEPVEPPQIEAAGSAPAPRPRRTRKSGPAEPPPESVAAEAPPAAEATPPAPEPEPEPEAEPSPPAVAETPAIEAAPPAPEPEPEPPPTLAIAEPVAEPVAPPAPPRQGASPEGAVEGVFAQPLRLERCEARPARSAPNSRTGLAFAAGALLGVAAGWGASQFTRPAPPPAEPPAQVAAAPAPAPPPIAPPAEPAPASEPSPLAAEFQPQSPELAPPAPEPPAAEEPKPVAAEPIDTPPPPSETAALPTAAPRAEVATEAKGCAAEQTPADRTICADPKLKRLQQQLQRAYAVALDAHEDRELLRQRQLAWREERNNVTDPDRLAEIYEARIHKLNSATEAAKRDR